MILKASIVGPMVLFLLYTGALPACDALMGWAGTPVATQVLGWESDQDGFRAMLAWPRLGWGGTESEARRDLWASGPDAVRLRMTRTAPALRLGRGSVQFLLVRPDGTPVDVEAMVWEASIIIAVAMAGVVFVVGPWLVERWLIARGRPVRGVVVAHARSNTRQPEYTVTYHYWELGEPGMSPTLTGRAVVSRARYEQVRMGQELTILHALWEPRTHVAYSLLREMRGERSAGARGPSQS